MSLANELRVTQTILVSSAVSGARKRELEAAIKKQAHAHPTCAMADLWDLTEKEVDWLRSEGFDVTMNGATSHLVSW